MSFLVVTRPPLRIPSTLRSICGSKREREEDTQKGREREGERKREKEGGTKRERREQRGRERGREGE